MIRVALCSPDLKLQPLLAPALGRDFQVLSEPDYDRLKQMLWGGQADVLLLDLDSESSNVERQGRVFEEINDRDVSTVILTDDPARPTAVDLVTRGAHGHCRKPPALRELKAMIRRACEHTAMKRELDGRQGTRFAQTQAAEMLRW